MTIGGRTHAVPLPFLVLATQNPIESEGTYPLPEAQVDRFLMKILVDYPAPGDEAAVVDRSLDPAGRVEERLTVGDLLRFREAVADVIVDREVDRLRGRAGRRDPPARPLRPDRGRGAAQLRRQPARPDRARPLGAGAGPAARAPPRARERRARPRARGAAPPARAELRGAERGRAARRPARAGHGGGARAGCAARRSRSRRERRAGRRRAAPATRPPGPGLDARARSWRRSTSRSFGASAASAPASTAARAWAAEPSSPSCAPTSRATTCARSTRRPRPAPGVPHVRQQVPERLLTTWLAMDVSPSMAFGTADRLKSDVADGVADVLGAHRRQARRVAWGC